MKKFLVIGNPIEHSLSPKLHNYWIKNNGIDAIYEKTKLDENELENIVLQIKQKKIYGIDAIYEKKKLDENELEHLVLQIKRKKIHGVNVTIPFKKAIIPFLDELTTEADSTQSVNTLFLKDNKVIGHNTDIIGFETSIKKSKFNILNKEVLILGAGGVVPSIIFALNKMKVSKIIISNRTREKAENLKKLFKNIEIIDWGEVPNSDMIINATSIGLKKEDHIILDFSLTSKNSLFYDVIYNPKETNF